MDSYTYLKGKTFKLNRNTIKETNKKTDVISNPLIRSRTVQKPEPNINPLPKPRVSQGLADLFRKQSNRSWQTIINESELKRQQRQKPKEREERDSRVSSPEIPAYTPQNRSILKIKNTNPKTSINSNPFNLSYPSNPDNSGNIFSQNININKPQTNPTNIFTTPSQPSQPSQPIQPSQPTTTYIYNPPSQPSQTNQPGRPTTTYTYNPPSQPTSPRNNQMRRYVNNIQDLINPSIQNNHLRTQLVKAQYQENGWRPGDVGQYFQKGKGLKTEQQIDVDNKVARIINRGGDTTKQMMVESISQQLLTRQKVDEQVSKLEALLFYEPSQIFKKSINKLFPESSPSEVIYASVVFKKQHLLDLKDAHKADVEHIYKWIKPWGQYLFDLKDMQKYANEKRGNSMNRMYILKAWGLEIDVKPDSIIVKYQGRQIDPQQFQWIYLRPKAIERLKNRAKSIYMKLTKQQNV